MMESVVGGHRTSELGKKARKSPLDREGGGARAWQGGGRDQTCLCSLCFTSKWWHSGFSQSPGRLLSSKEDESFHFSPFLRECRHDGQGVIAAKEKGGGDPVSFLLTKRTKPQILAPD